MGWLFGQVWILCLVAFLAGAAVTWIAFVRPRRDAGQTAGSVPGWTPVPEWVSGGGTARVERSAAAVQRPPAPPAGPPVDPALAALDTGGPRPAAGTGVTATGALDRLGVAGSTGDRTAPGGSARADPPPAGGSPTPPGRDRDE